MRSLQFTRILQIVSLNSRLNVKLIEKTAVEYEIFSNIHEISPLLMQFSWIVP